MRAYAYRCHDYSLLTPVFKKWLVAPLLPFVPWVVPANLITITSNLFVYLGFFVALYFQGPASRIVVSICMLLYLIGDHLDGMQAKRTQTGSALGEFCDHYLDAFNNGIILFTTFLVFGVTNPWLVAVVITASYLAHMSVFYEQFKTGWLTFEKLGSLEGVLLTAILIGVSAFDPVMSFFSLNAVAGFCVIEVVFMLSAMAAVGTFITTLRRTPGKQREVWFFTLGIFVLMVLTPGYFTSIEIFAVLTLYASLYVGLVMQGHLVDGVERMPDLVVPFALIVLQFLPVVDTLFAFWALSLYLFVRIGILVVSTFSALKIYWVWSNPRI